MLTRISQSDAGFNGRASARRCPVHGIVSEVRFTEPPSFSLDTTRGNLVLLRLPDRINRLSTPPSGFVAKAIIVPAMGPAELDCNLPMKGSATAVPLFQSFTYCRFSKAYTGPTAILVDELDACGFIAGAARSLDTVSEVESTLSAARLAPVHLTVSSPVSNADRRPIRRVPLGNRSVSLYIRRIYVVEQTP
jgi:hypothetical protein